MSRPVRAVCSAISVVITVLAPANSTKDAAICVTAKIRWRRLVLPVIRAPLDRLWPLDVSADGRRGTNAKITAATTASAAPTQSRLEIDRQIESADREARGVTGQDGYQRLRAPYTDRGPRAAKAEGFRPAACGAARLCLRRAPHGSLARLRDEPSA